MKKQDKLIDKDTVSKMQHEFEPNPNSPFRMGMYSGYAFGLQDGYKLAIESEIAKEKDEPCANCKEIGDNCACMRNKCIRCGNPVGNITFTVCDDCWTKEHKKDEPKMSAEDYLRTYIMDELPTHRMIFDVDEILELLDGYANQFKQ